MAAHLAISGNIATGKTTLSKLIEDELGYFRVGENPRENEFLSEFYSAMSRWALPSQLSFILSRAHEISRSSRLSSHVVLDRTISEDINVFCRTLNDYSILEDRELRLIERLDSILKQSVPEPDLYVYLEDSAENILQRIYNRAQPYELGIEVEYIRRLNDHYRSWAKMINPSKLMRIDTSTLDFTQAEGRAHVLNKIRRFVVRE